MSDAEAPTTERVSDLEGVDPEKRQEMLADDRNALMNEMVTQLQRLNTNVEAMMDTDQAPSAPPMSHAEEAKATDTDDSQAAQSTPQAEAESSPGYDTDAVQQGVEKWLGEELPGWVLAKVSVGWDTFDGDPGPTFALDYIDDEDRRETAHTMVKAVGQSNENIQYNPEEYYNHIPAAALPQVLPKDVIPDE